MELRIDHVLLFVGREAEKRIPFMLDLANWQGIF